MSDTSFGDEWFHRKNAAFRQACEQKDFAFIADYAIMISSLLAEPRGDEKLASLELAQTFENTAFVLEGMNKNAEAKSFASRAEAVRLKVDRDELQRMMAAPKVMPEICGPCNKPFEPLMQHLVAAAWQAAGQPPQPMAWQVMVSQDWRLCAAWKNFVIWVFDLESPIKDELGRTGREHFMQSAKNPFVRVEPAPDGKTVREQVIHREVLRIQASRLTDSAPQSILVGYFLCKLLGPQPKPAAN